MKWPTVQLRRVTSKVGSGATPRGGEEVYQSSGTPLIRSMNVHFEGFRRKGLVFIDNDEAAQLDHVAVQPDDVLFNITGASIGRVTTAPADMAGARVNQHVCILRTTDALLPRFLAYYMATPAQQAVVNSNQVGGTRQAVTKAKLLDWPVPLPAPTEQRRIVELLEQADGLRRQRAEADALADRVLPALFHKMFGDPGTNPKGWVQVPLGKLIAEPQFGVSVALSDKTEQKEGQLPVLRIANITNDGYLDTSDLRYDSVSPRKKAELLLRKGDLLFNWRNSPNLVGKTAIFDAEGEFIFASFLFRLQVIPQEAEGSYIWFLLNLLRRQRWFEAKCRQAVSQANFGRGELAAIPLAKPPLELQRRFAVYHESCQRLRAARVQSGERLQQLFKLLLHRAFTGELTAKWREAHLKELLAEVEHQARLLRLADQKN